MARAVQGGREGRSARGWLRERVVEPACGACLGAVLMGCLLSSCGGDEPTGPSLWSDELVPEVLTEDGRIALPQPAAGEGMAANRYLAGWAPWLHGKQPVMAVRQGGARLQVVQLADRPRTLYLDLLDGESSALPALTVRVSPVGRPASWREVEGVVWNDPVVVRLPEGLPPGRWVVEIDRARREPPQPLDVVAGRLRPNLPAGNVDWRGGDLVQSGWSRVEAVRHVAAGEVLVGEFHPPDDPEEGQVFRAEVEDARGAVVSRFEWREGQPGWSQSVRLETGGESGLVRFVFTAQGTGPAATWEGLRWAEERSPELERRAKPPAAAGFADGEPPRLVMVYVMDALRADHVGPEGDGDGDGAQAKKAGESGQGQLGSAGRPAAETFDRLAAEGVAFTQHRSVAPSTLPSTRALFTGRLQPEAADAGEAVLLAEQFRDAGYRTALFSGNPYIGPAYGLDRGFDHVAEDVLFTDGEHTFNDNAARVHAAALAWLEGLAPGERAFVYLHTIHPHNPYDPPRDLARAYARGIGSRIDGSTETLVEIQRQRRRVNGADRARLAALYAAAFAYNDRELAGFLEGAAQYVPPSDTLLALTSDHGEELFDHGGVLHGYTLYEEQLRIPLVLWSPDRLPPGSVSLPTTTLDLHATLLGLLPGHRPASTSEGGVDLLASTPPRRPHYAAAPSVRNGLLSLRLGDLKLIAAPGGPRTWGMGLGRGRSRDPEYVFDLAHDPAERRNHVGLGGIEEDWLRSRLRAWTPTRRRPHADRPTDPETRKKLEALGYLR